VIARSSRVTDPTSSNRPVSGTSTDSKCRARKSASGGAKESPSSRSAPLPCAFVIVQPPSAGPVAEIAGTSGRGRRMTSRSVKRHGEEEHPHREVAALVALHHEVVVGERRQLRAAHPTGPFQGLHDLPVGVEGPELVPVGVRLVEMRPRASPGRPQLRPRIGAQPESPRPRTAPTRPRLRQMSWLSLTVKRRPG
jgi:hypothetical protein